MGRNDGKLTILLTGGLPFGGIGEPRPFLIVVKAVTSFVLKYS